MMAGAMSCARSGGSRSSSHGLPLAHSLSSHRRHQLTRDGTASPAIPPPPYTEPAQSWQGGGKMRGFLFGFLAAGALVGTFLAGSIWRPRAEAAAPTSRALWDCYGFGDAPSTVDKVRYGLSITNISTGVTRVQSQGFDFTGDKTNVTSTDPDDLDPGETSVFASVPNTGATHTIITADRPTILVGAWVDYLDDNGDVGGTTDA